MISQPDTQSLLKDIYKDVQNKVLALEARLEGIDKKLDEGVQDPAEG